MHKRWLQEITHVAILGTDGQPISLPKPNRHHHVIRHMCEHLGYEHVPASLEQGFLLKDGSFVRRLPAARIAVATGQIEELKWPPQLYSEDLW